MASVISASTTSGTALNMSADTTGVLQLATGATPTTAVTIDTSQNVGIGTTSPASKLEISDGFSTATSTGLSLTSTNSNGYGGGIRFYVSPPTAGKYTAAFLNTENSNGTANDGGRLKFYTAADDASHTLTERMRIDSSGNVLINTTSVVNSSRLNVVENLTSLNGIGIKNTGTTYAASTDFIVFVNSADALAGRIAHTAVTTVAYTTTSDYRLKENIVPMAGALNKILQLKPVTYTWKQDGSNGQGFIAHELQEIVSDCVVGEKDAVDEEGNPSYQSIDTSFLVATLTAAIQEQQQIITDLKATVDSQVATINDLKARIETLEAK